MDFHSQENIRASANIRAWEDATVQSQYSTSPILKALVLNFDFSISPNVDVSTFYQKIFDVDTAEGVGLDIWGRIVGVNRAIAVDSDDYFGFYGSLLQPANQAPFWRGEQATDLYTMTDRAYRRLIMWKAMANIATADAASLNALAASLFDDARVYVLESGIMQIRMVFEFALEPYQRSIFRQYGLFAKGAAVGFEWLECPIPCFGFAGSGMQPFNQEGPFFVGGITHPREGGN